MDRRAYLGAMGTVAATLAGCASDGGETSPDPDTASGDTRTTSGFEPGTTSASKSVTTTATHADYETTTLQAETPDGEVLGSVTAAIADTSSLRYTGLSDTDHLPSDRGMLFVYETVADRTFVMREMDFGIDIVYADAEGRITSIHHAPEPGPEEDGDDQRYPGRGQYVLEVAYDWTTEHDVQEGDRLAFTLPE